MGGTVGLDLSLRRTGACFVPQNWNGDYKFLVFKSIETQKDKSSVSLGRPGLISRSEIERYIVITKKIVRFVNECEPSDVAIERYAFSMAGNSASVTGLAELTGIVKMQLLLACGIPPISVSANSCRSFLMGGIKKGKQKEQVEKFMNNYGFQFSNRDEMDAFVVAYYWHCQLSRDRSIFVRQKNLNV